MATYGALIATHFAVPNLQARFVHWSIKAGISASETFHLAAIFTKLALFAMWIGFPFVRSWPVAAVGRLHPEANVRAMVLLCSTFARLSLFIPPATTV